MRKSGYEIKVKLLVGVGLHIIEVSGSSILTWKRPAKYDKPLLAHGIRPDIKNP